MAGPKNVDSRLTLRRRTSCRSGLAPWRNQQRNAMRIAEAQRRAACACAMRDKSRLTATDVRRAHAVAPKSISEVFGERRWSQPWIGSEWVADTRTDRDRSNGVIWAGGARKDELKVIADDDDDRARCLDARGLSWTWREQGSAWRHRHAARRDVDNRSGRCCALNWGKRRPRCV